MAYISIRNLSFKKLARSLDVYIRVGGTGSTGAKTAARACACIGGIPDRQGRA